ncbi:MAG: bifunctional ornithine acetyltransferase/N-acetylglutamate synthase, partial [Eggerthellaceae bacterium]
MADLTLCTIEGGGVASARGFKAGGIHAGFREDPNRLDMALVEADELCAAAGVFTQNVFCAAPVIVSREHLENRGFGLARAMVINSGTANAATGSVGLDNARKTAALVADTVGCAEEDVLVASTGVIGQQLDMAPFEAAVPELHAALWTEDAADEVQRNANGHRAARAIMTTDTVPKEFAVSYESQCAEYAGCTFTVGGMAKGSGMIMP